MKTKLLLAGVFLTLCVFSQKSGIKSGPTGVVNLKPLIQVELNESSDGSMNYLPQNEPRSGSSNLSQNSDSKTSAVNSWTNVTTSPSPYGSLISFCKPLHYNDELGAVCFIHRRPNTYVTSPPSGTSQQVNALISTDFGNTWDSTMVWDDANNWARYPGGNIYNPPGNSLLSAAYVVVAGPTTPAAGGWNGNYYGSKSLASFNNTASTVPNAQQWMDIANPNPNVGRHDFAAYAYTATDDGKMRNLAGVKDDNTGRDTAVMLITGTFNSGVFSYTGTRLNPPTTVDGVGDDNWVSRPSMAWNESGTVGYIAVMGQRTGSSGRNTGLQPIVWKTTNSGASWAVIPGVDFDAPEFSDVVYHLTAQGSSTLEVPNFIWTEGFDMTVDANNKLHLFSALVGHYSVDPDSLFYTSAWGSDGYKWPHIPGLRPYLYDFITDGSNPWTYTAIDSMSTEGASGVPSGAGFNENPWSISGTDKLRLDARIQMSRTPDGKFIFYSWTESDTNFTSSAKKFNVLPNIKVRAYDVDEDLVSGTEENITSPSVGPNPNVASRAFWHFMSSKTTSAAVTVVNPVLTTMSAKLPFTTSNNPALISAAASTSHWYNTSEITFSFSSGNVSLTENTLTNPHSSFIYPNPCRNDALVTVQLQKSEKIVIDLYSLTGAHLLSEVFSGQSGENRIQLDLSNIEAGVYLVNVRTDYKGSSHKLIKE